MIFDKYQNKPLKGENNWNMIDSGTTTVWNSAQKETKSNPN